MAESFPQFDEDVTLDVVNIILEGIASHLNAGGRAEFRGFGSFWTTPRPARVGRNPATGEPVHIPAKRIIRFGPSDQLSAKLSEAMRRQRKEHRP